MRQIKFRAYIQGEMIGADSLAFEEYGLLKDQLNSEPCLMQYTGLKDKSGVEIYEGDILAWHERVCCCNNQRPISVVEWNPLNKMAGFNVMSPFIDIFDSDKIKVIGNIYEDPELVE